MDYIIKGQFKLKRKIDFVNEESFLNRLKRLSQISYLDTTALLERESKHCRNIIYYEDDCGELICFAMYNFEPLEETETVYFGLTVCVEEYKKYGLAKKLWLQIAVETKKREEEIRTSILCWLTTPTPIVFYWFNKFLISPQPYIDGSYTQKGKELVEKLIRAKYPKISPNGTNPFKIEGVASNTIYSLSERLRISKASIELGIKAFDTYKVDETKGDRFLILGYIPQRRNYELSEW